MLHPPGGSVANDPAYRAGQASSSAAGAYRPAIAATGRDEARLRSEFHYTPKRGGSEWHAADQGLTGNVADLLRMATFAHRQGCGQLIWFGWCPHEGGRHGKSWPWKGSHGLMLTKKGAASVAQAMAAGKVVRGHIDLVLLDWLRTEGEATNAGACFIYPSIGSYFAHPSGCDPKGFGEAQGGRPSGFTTKDPAQGTRLQHDLKQRGKYLVQWLGTGDKARERNWIKFPVDSELHSDAYRWKSFWREPTASPGAPRSSQ